MTPTNAFQDACNRKTNHQHLGTIQSSNLCTEIVEYTDPDEVAVCNLGSVVLPKFVSEDGKEFDHRRLFEVRGYDTWRVLVYADKKALAA